MVFPRRSNKPKAGDASKEELAAVSQATGRLLPITHTAHAVELETAKITEEMQVCFSNRAVLLCDFAVAVRDLLGLLFFLVPSDGLGVPPAGVPGVLQVAPGAHEQEASGQACQEGCGSSGGREGQGQVVGRYGGLCCWGVSCPLPPTCICVCKQRPVKSGIFLHTKP